MKTSIPRTLLTAIPALAAAGCTENPAPRPNVIFILMDDAGYGDFGCYGQQKIETPNIDALSELGIRFTDMYSAAPLSSPARCGLLTGRHAGHAQIRANDEMEWRGDVWNHEAMLRDSTLEGQAPLEAGTPTLGSVMQQAGYATAMIGKWGVGGPATEGTPNKMGFTPITAAFASDRRTPTTRPSCGKTTGASTSTTNCCRRARRSTQGPTPTTRAATTNTRSAHTAPTPCTTRCSNS